MKSFPIRRLAGIPLSACVSLLPAVAWAADSPDNWRSTYDMGMMWVNFLILMVLLIKFLRPPARNFLKTYKETLDNKLNKLEAEKTQAQEALHVFRESMQARKTRWKNRYRTIIAQGERERQALIEDARTQAHRLMDNTNRQIEVRVREAGQRLKGEIVDNAIDVAMVELQAKMTPEIERRWLAHFLKGIAATSPLQALTDS
ncbi:MAG: ATP synthase F0 subunit B [Desulfosarcina sp.]|nr:ATP synthase F0 subunit B [Desulfobacterales bacterium]